MVITADDTAGVGALLRWDPAGYAQRELALRQELQLPPAVRIASVTGGRTAVGHFTQAIEQQLGAAGDRAADGGPGAPGAAPGLRPPAGPGRDHGSRRGKPARTSGRCCSSRMPRPAEATRVMRAVKAAAAAKRSDDPVQLRLDGVDVL